MYLSITIVIVNPSKEEVDENKLLQEIKNLLSSILIDAQFEEDKIPKRLKNMEFQQQENFRDVVRLKHAIQKFLDSKNCNLKMPLTLIENHFKNFISLSSFVKFYK
jgi:hypothetical protein